MNWLQILLSTLIGTTLMTVFSYLYSRARNKRFKEPELLNELLVRVRILAHTSSKQHVAGWLIHYGVGLGFVISYHIIWIMFDITPDFVRYLAAGIVSGIIGIIAWRTVLIRFELIESSDQSEYFFQLEIAHVIFGIGAFMSVCLW